MRISVSVFLCLATRAADATQPFSTSAARRALSDGLNIIISFNPWYTDSSDLLYDSGDYDIYCNSEFITSYYADDADDVYCEYLKRKISKHPDMIDFKEDYPYYPVEDTLKQSISTCEQLYAEEGASADYWRCANYAEWREYTDIPHSLNVVTDFLRGNSVVEADDEEEYNELVEPHDEQMSCLDALLSSILRIASTMDGSAFKEWALGVLSPLSQVRGVDSPSDIELLVPSRRALLRGGGTATSQQKKEEVRTGIGPQY